MVRKKKVILAVLDGVGYRKERYGNALANAYMPNFNSFISDFPNSLLIASGSSVGLPKGQMGNSEVGHLTIGAGRVVLQPLVRINKSISTKEFFKNRNLISMFDHVNNNDSKLHIFGLLSDGGIHSHIDHILALLKACKMNGVKKVYVHVFTDGRDTKYNVCLKYIKKLDSYMKFHKIGKIATICGRYFAMDREEKWDRVKMAYDAISNNIGKHYKSYYDAVNDSYAANIYDEFIEPIVLDSSGMVADNDGIIMANFRPDRIVEILKCFSPCFSSFKVNDYSNLKVATMMSCDSLDCVNIFENENVNNTLGEVLSNHGYMSLRISEVSKFPHVTHFFDGDKDVDFPNTDKIRIDGQDVSTFDLAPGMSSEIVTDKIISTDKYDFIFVNFPNGDMVGHTGNYKACIDGLETVDICLGKLYKYAIDNDYLLIIVADHGNAEEMKDKRGNPITTHTTNKVRMIVCDKTLNVSNGTLADIAPSILRICNIDIPNDMSGNIIIK